MKDLNKMFGSQTLAIALDPNRADIPSPELKMRPYTSHHSPPKRKSPSKEKQRASTAKAPASAPPAPPPPPAEEKAVEGGLSTKGEEVYEPIEGKD